MILTACAFLFSLTGARLCVVVLLKFKQNDSDADAAAAADDDVVDDDTEGNRHWLILWRISNSDVSQTICNNGEYTFTHSLTYLLTNGRVADFGAYCWSKYSRRANIADSAHLWADSL